MERAIRVVMVVEEFVIGESWESVHISKARSGTQLNTVTTTSGSRPLAALLPHGASASRLHFQASAQQ